MMHNRELRYSQLHKQEGEEAASLRVDNKVHGMPNHHYDLRNHVNTQKASGQVITKQMNEKIVRARQRRLKLLYHSSMCPITPGSPCLYSLQCGETKALWQHMEICVSQRCDFPHCISSRSLLKHYRMCKIDSCSVCAPIRSFSKATRFPQDEERTWDVRSSQRLAKNNDQHLKLKRAPAPDSFVPENSL